ncbi:unnamed protein product [Staurois parvus]|uniref:Uncharacterized protein n=1 Tax=Staurois parvus TaxID=386267 RepID=A0ABN9DJH7_9NEOB|nr:unnamed protein product [Staurois parvus]
MIGADPSSDSCRLLAVLTATQLITEIAGSWVRAPGRARFGRTSYDALPELAGCGEAIIRLSVVGKWLKLH